MRLGSGLEVWSPGEAAVFLRAVALRSYLLAFLPPLLVVLALAVAAPPAQAAEVVYPPGSRLGLAPPAGMATSRNFFGFEDLNESAAIILAALPAAAARADSGGVAPFKINDPAGFETGELLPGRAVVLGDPPAPAPAQPLPHIFVS